MKLLIYFILFFSSLSCVSQIINKEFAIKQCVKNSSLILDGKADVAGMAFRGSNNAIYTPYYFTVSKIISGKLDTTKIIILLDGGQIEENGMGLGTGVAHGINILPSLNSIIFCSKSELTNCPNSYMVYEQVCYNAKNEIIPFNFLSEFYKNKQTLLNDLGTTLSSIQAK